jgi:hypothetical protein
MWDCMTIKARLDPDLANSDPTWSSDFGMDDGYASADPSGSAISNDSDFATAKNAAKNWYLTSGKSRKACTRKFA